MSFSTGDKLGPYEILAPIGAGGMGEVYRAHDSRLGRDVAIKVSLEEFSQRFEREARAIAALNHPHICTLYDVGPNYLVMEYLVGTPLRGPLPLDQALRYGLQICEALEAAHQKNITHRDLKPGNILMTAFGVKLLDFGLAKIALEKAAPGKAGTGVAPLSPDATTMAMGLTAAGTILVTAAYMSHEQTKGEEADARSDIFSFGLVLYEMLTGRHPFARNSAIEIMAAIVRDEPAPLDAPVRLCAIIARCLRKLPADRFQTMNEVRMALEAVTATPTGDLAYALDARPSVSPFTSALFSMSRRRAAGLASVAGSAGAGALWLGWPRISRMLHPLPEKRFIAVLAWPPVPDSPLRPLLQAILDAISNSLARAEAKDRKLMVISANEVAGFVPPKELRDVVSSLGTNLVAAASLQASRSGYRLALQILEAATGTVLRQRDLAINSAGLSSLAELASAAISEMLDLPSAPVRLKDQEEQSKLSPPSYQLFTEAEELREQPNNVGLDQAIERYQKLLDREPRFALGYAKLSFAYSRKHILSSNAAWLRLADKNAELALRFNPDSAMANLSRGLTYYYAGKNEQAIVIMNRALQIDPGNPMIMVNKARAFHDLGRYREEEQGYREVIRLRPNYWPAYSALGTTLYGQNRYQEAADVYGEAAAIAPHVATPLVNQGAAYFALGRDEDAEESFRRSLERAPNAAAYSNLGSLMFKRGDHRQALNYYQKARELNPRNHVTWRNIADCYAMLGDQARETESWGKAAMEMADRLKVNARSGSNWALLAFYHAKAGFRAEAGSDLKAAAERSIDERGQFYKVQALAVLGRKEEALELLLKCFDQGRSINDIELALDLKELRADPRFRRHVAQRGAK